MTLETVLVVAAALAIVFLFARANRKKDAPTTRTQVPSGGSGGEGGGDVQRKPDGVGKPETPNEM